MATTEHPRGWARAARRYGPIVVVLGVVAAVVVVFAGDDDDDGGDGAADGGSTSQEDLIASGPMTWQRAEQEDVTEDIEWGPNCDTETGKIRLPTIYAAPCVEPFEGDNGGATATGVTADTVKIVAYVSDPEIDPVGASLIIGAGANLDPDAATDTMRDYVDVFNAVFETYGRTVEIEFFTGTGPSDDRVAARNDAIAIAEREPFLVVGGPTLAGAVFNEELAARGVISFAGPLAESIVADNYPYIWGNMTPEQAATLAAEAIGNLAGPGPAELAGDPELRAEDRSYAVVYFDTTEGDYRASIDVLQDGLADRGVEVAESIEYVLDPAQAQEDARTMITRLKAADVTTVIFQGDFLMPQFLTTEATAQEYFPEWILGPNLLADTEIFGRTYDRQQWSNGFGVAYAGTPQRQEGGSSYQIYTWAYEGAEPPSNIYAVLEAPLRAAFTAVHLAGPELTPDSFADGSLRYPPTGGGPTSPLISRGEHGIWREFDYGDLDEIALLWWDPEAESEDEVGNTAAGSYRFANGGERYQPGEVPTSIEEAGLFDEASSVISYEQPPPEDRAPDYPPPDL
jgi:hypothetical protein